MSAGPRSRSLKPTDTQSDAFILARQVAGKYEKYIPAFSEQDIKQGWIETGKAVIEDDDNAYDGFAQEEGKK
jgi:hypothetical protein